MKSLKIALFAIALFFVGDVSAQKIGYVNSQEIINEMPAVKEANSNIEAFQSQLQRKGQEMVQALQTKYADIEKNRDNYSPVQLEQEAQKLKEEEAKILEFDQTSQQKILEKSESLLAPIRQKIQDAINQVSKDKGFDYVFDYSLGFVLYADPSTDISSDVKAKLGL